MTKPARIRAIVVLSVIGLSALFVLGRYASLAAKGKPARAPAASEVVRGSIVDRSGRILAMDTALYNIAVWKPETDSGRFKTDSGRLASLLELGDADLAARYDASPSDFFYIKKRVSPQVARAIQDAKAGGDFDGIVVERVEGRLYPEKSLAAHLLGFVGDGNRGLEGIEGKYEDDLGEAAAAAREALAAGGGTGGGASGKTTAKAGGSAVKAAGGGDGGERRGNDLVLSIDSAMQFSLEEIARKAMKDTGAESVFMLAGDVRTGEILAYVAMPDFDPNAYFEYPQESWYDWPSVYSYEPGSVFKVFSLASILDLGGIGAASTFTCDGAYHHAVPNGEPITIKCLGVHGKVTPEKILEYSCNAGAGYASDTVQALDFYDRLLAFGFGARTGVALPGEAAGLLTSPDTWSLRSKPTIAMGQEILVTGVQMLQAAVAVASGGVLRKPVVVRKVLSPSGALVWENQPQAVRRVVSESTARAILDDMEQVATRQGTGWRAKVSDIRMAVKTGTAQMIDKTTKRYSETDYIASTLAIFPAEAPRIALYLAIVKPKGASYYGGQIAAPVVRDAADAILGISDLPRGDSPTLTGPAAISLPKLSPVSVGQVMPDLRGTPKRLLLPLLARTDLVVKIAGEGYVESQSPAPGTAVSPGMTLEFNLK